MYKALKCATQRSLIEIQKLVTKIKLTKWLKQQKIIR